MKLSEYLNKLFWSQSELARRAEISLPTVKKAIDGKVITRASALRIVKTVGDAFGTEMRAEDFDGMKVESLTVKKRDTRRKSAKKEG